MISPYINVIKKRNFSLLWFGQIISQFGDRLTQMALVGLVYRFEPGSSLSLAKIFSLAIIPVFLISPVAGVYIDRWNKQKTMYLSDISRGILILAIPLIINKFHSLTLIYVLIFFSFCAGRFFIPAKMSIVPLLVSKKEIFLANSLISITAMIAAVLGFGLGGVIVEKYGVETAFYIDATTFLISGLLILFMRIKEQAVFRARDIFEIGKNAILNVKNSFLFEVKEGFRYILTAPETRYAAKILFILFAFIGSLYTTFIVFIQNTLSTVTSALGWLAVAAGAGLFIGSLIYGRFASKMQIKKTTNNSLFLAGLFLTTFVCVLHIYPNKIFAFFSCLILGIICAPLGIALNSLIHHESDNHLWGRIFSSLEVIIHLGFIIFMFLASYLAEKSNPFTIIFIISIMITFFSMINIIHSKKDSK